MWGSLSVQGRGLGEAVTECRQACSGWPLLGQGIGSPQPPEEWAFCPHLTPSQHSAHFPGPTCHQSVCSPGYFPGNRIRPSACSQHPLPRQAWPSPVSSGSPFSLTLPIPVLPTLGLNPALLSLFSFSFCFYPFSMISLPLLYSPLPSCSAKQIPLSVLGWIIKWRTPPHFLTTPKISHVSPKVLT